MFALKYRGRIFLITLAVAVLMSAAEAPAQLGSREAKQWIQNLENPKRIAGLKIDEVVRLLKLQPGDNVADIGAGAGAFSLPLAKAVAPSGKAYAVDIDPGLLEYIAEKARKQGVENIQTVKGEFNDPKLPARDIDLAFFNDVLHHIENRAAYLKALSAYIKPTGRVALIDNNGAAPHNPHRNNPQMLLTKEEINQWMAAAGFYPVEEFNLFGPAKWFIIYARR